MVALSPKAILEGRSSNRAPVPLVVGMVAAGFCTFLVFLYFLVNGGVGSTLLSSTLIVPTGIALVGLLLLIDRLEPEPPLHLVFTFLWGAGVAVLGSLVLNTGTESALLTAMSSDSAEVLGGAVVAPLVEESLKGSLLLLLLAFRRQELDGPTDGIVYAGFVGLGFALVEDVLYYLQTATVGELVQTVLMRGLLFPLSHPLFSAMIGLGVAYAATHRGPSRWVAVVGGWLGAVALHALWNGMTTFGGAGLAIAWLVLFLVLIALIAVLVRDRGRIIRLIRTHLPAYGPSGLVQPNDVQMLGTVAGRRQARRWARANAGLRGVRAMGDYQLAATELALLHDRAANGAIEPAPFYARRDAILALMRAARDAFFRRTPQVRARPAPWASNGRSGFFHPPTPGSGGPLPDFQTTRQMRTEPPGGRRQVPSAPPPPSYRPPQGGPLREPGPRADLPHRHQPRRHRRDHRRTVLLHRNDGAHHLRRARHHLPDHRPNGRVDEPTDASTSIEDGPRSQGSRGHGFRGTTGPGRGARPHTRVASWVVRPGAGGVSRATSSSQCGGMSENPHRGPASPPPNGGGPPPGPRQQPPGSSPQAPGPHQRAPQSPEEQEQTTWSQSPQGQVQHSPDPPTMQGPAPQAPASPGQGPPPGPPRQPPQGPPQAPPPAGPPQAPPPAGPPGQAPGPPQAGPPQGAPRGPAPQAAGPQGPPQAPGPQGPPQGFPQGAPPPGPAQQGPMQQGPGPQAPPQAPGPPVGPPPQQPNPQQPGVQQAGMQQGFQQPGVQQPGAQQVPPEPSAPSPSGTRIYERLAEPQDPEPHQPPPPKYDRYQAAYDDYDDEGYDDYDDEPYDEPPRRPRRRPPERGRRSDDEYDDYEDEPRSRRRSEPREESQVDYQRKRDRRSDRINVLANIIYVATGLITTVFVLHIVFTLFGANASSGFVAFVYQTSKVFVLGFGDVFQPGDATIGLVLNYGLAAVVYWVVGRLIARTLKSR